MKLKLFEMLFFGLAPRLMLTFAEDGSGEGGGGGGEGGGDGGAGSSGGDGGGEGGEGGAAGGEGGGEGGGITMAAFRESLPEDLRSHGVFDKYGDDVGEFGKGITELAALASRKGDIPKDWNDEASVNEFWGKVGVPTEADGYEFDVPEDFELSDEYTSKLRESALEAKIPASNLKAFVEKMLGFEYESAKQSREKANAIQLERQNRLASEWGEATVEMSLEVAQLASKLGATEKDLAEIQASPAAQILLGKVSSMLAERGQGPGAFSSTRGGVEAEFATAKSELGAALAKNGRNMTDPAIQPIVERYNMLQDKLLAMS